jgi:1-acyl-sn-glycerol-3-phosphate acyltransferase
MVRSLFLLTVGVVVTAFISLFIVVIYPLSSGGENTIHRVARLWAKILLCISGVKADVTGEDNLVTGGPQIVMANHQSSFDIFLALAYIPLQFRWIAKKELFGVPLFGLAMKKAGYIEIDRRNRESAMKSLDEAAEKVRNGKSLMTFPEGTRSRDGSVGPFKKGLFYLAIQSGVPIIPVSIIGSGEIMPKRSLKIIPKKVKIIIGSPVDVKNYTVENHNDLIERVRGAITENLRKGMGVAERENGF